MNTETLVNERKDEISRIGVCFELTTNRQWEMHGVPPSSSPVSKDNDLGRTVKGASATAFILLPVADVAPLQFLDDHLLLNSFNFSIAF